jgi:hypothetical protein
MPFVWLNYNTMILWHSYTTLNSSTVGVLNIIRYFCVYITVSSNFFLTIWIMLMYFFNDCYFCFAMFKHDFFRYAISCFHSACVFLDCHFSRYAYVCLPRLSFFSRYAYVCLPQLSFFSLCLCISSSIVLVFAMLVFLPLCAYVCLPTL